MNRNIEHLLDQNEKKMAELEISHQKLTDLTKELYETLKLNPEQIDCSLADPSRFSEDHWEFIRSLRQQLDEKLQKELSTIRDPLTMKKKYQERHIGSHWLFVK
jgi:hypothetical protein